MRFSPWPPRLQTEEKHARLFAALKRRHTIPARGRRGGAIQPVIRQCVPGAGLLHQIEKAGELGKDEGAVPLIQQDLQPFH